MAKNIYKKIVPALLCAALLAGSLAGCSGQDEEQKLPEVTSSGAERPGVYAVDDKFTLNSDREVSFNPFTTNNAANILCTQVMYDCLFDVGPDFAFTGDLVKEWKSDDGKSWYFYVDTSVKFWDGTTLTAADASYSIQRAMRSPQFQSRLSGIIGVSAVDESLFVINLYQADMLFPTMLDIPVIKSGSVGEFVPMGTGPYTINEECTMLTAFPDYRYADSIPIDKIYLKEYKQTDEIITAFENSEIDMVTNDPTGSYNLGYGSANEIRSYPTSNMHYIGFNSKGRIFSSAPARRAMTYIIDRERIVSDVLNGAGSAAALPMNPASQYYNEAYSDVLSYSVAKSEEALDAANIQDYDNDGFREVMFTGIPIESDLNFIVAADSAMKVSAARMIAANMEALGIKVHLKELAWNDYVNALTSGDFDMYYAETKLTGSFSIRPLVLKNGILNYGGFADAVLEEYVEAYMAAPDDTRQRAADMMFKTLTDIAPIVPICFEKQQVITHRGIISGMQPSQYNVFRNFNQWRISFD